MRYKLYHTTFSNIRQSHDVSHNYQIVYQNSDFDRVKEEIEIRRQGDNRRYYIIVDTTNEKMNLYCGGFLLFADIEA